MRNPYLTLGVTTDADDEQIHQAYLARLRESPPERDPERFQAIRHAYESIRTRRLRLTYELFHAEPPELADLLEAALRPGTPRRPKEQQIRGVLSNPTSRKS